MRSQGQVRFIKVSAKVQMVGAAIVAALLLVWLLSMAGMAISQYLSTRDRLALLDREAKVATAESRVAEYRDDLQSVAQDLSRRQDALEKMTEVLPDDIKAADTVSDSTGEAAKTVDKVSAALPEAAGLAKIEARQLALVERLTRFADHRSAVAAQRIRALGLDPRAMVARLNDRSAQGGPLIELFGPSKRGLDPRFERLGLSLARMDALSAAWPGFPSIRRLASNTSPRALAIVPIPSPAAQLSTPALISRVRSGPRSLRLQPAGSASSVFSRAMAMWSKSIMAMA